MKRKIIVSSIIVFLCFISIQNRITAMEINEDTKAAVTVSTLDELNNEIANAADGDIITINGSIEGIATVNGKNVKLTGGTLQALNITNGSKVTLENITVDANQIGNMVNGKSGAAILMDDSTLILGTGSVVKNGLNQNSRLAEARISLGASAIGMTNKSYLEIWDGAVIQDNTSVATGFNNAIPTGAAIVVQSSKLIMYGGKIHNNVSEAKRAFASGGGILSVSSESSIEIYDGEISNNRSQVGAGIGLEGGNVHIYGGTISNNTASEYGGGIEMGNALLGYTCSLEVDDGVVISDNKAGAVDLGYGGGLAILNGNAKFHGGVIKGNSAIDSGGGLYVLSNEANILFEGPLTVEGNTLTDGVTPNNVMLDYYPGNTSTQAILKQIGKFTGSMGISVNMEENKNSYDVIINDGYDPEENMAEDKTGANSIVYSDNTEYLTQYKEDGSNHKIVLSRYEVRFDARGGSLDAGYNNPQYLGANQKVTQPPDPILDGHIFLGWAKAPHSSLYYDFNEIVTNDMTLYAVWKPEVYLIQLDANGGEGTMPDLIHNGKESVQITKNIFTREHYIFKGWNTQADGNGSVIADESMYTAGSNDVILYAQWEKERHKVIFDTNGGTVISDAEIAYDTVVSEPAAPQKSGYQFDGWYKDSALSTVWDFAADKVLEETRLYAKWTPLSYKISYNANTGAGTIPEQNFFTGENITLTQNTFTKTGYAFESWNTQADGKGTKYNDGAVIDNIAPGDITLYAQWSVQEPSVLIEIPASLELKDNTDGYAKQTDSIRVIKNPQDAMWEPDNDIIIRTQTGITLTNDRSADTYDVSVFKSDDTQYTDADTALMTLNAKSTDRLSDTFTLRTKTDHTKTGNGYRGSIRFVIELKP